METMYCLTDKAFDWLILQCDDEVSLTYFEEDWDGCTWMPVTALLNYMTEETLNDLLKAVRTFTLEDTQAFDAKQLITC